MTTSLFRALLACFGSCILLLGVQLRGEAAASPYPEGHYSRKNPLYVLLLVDERPEPLSQPMPERPPELKDRKDATLVVDFVIRKDGAIEFPRIIESNDAQFNAFLLDAVMHWKFKPALKKGKPVNCRVSQRIDFN
jgi:TonB family protein